MCCRGNLSHDTHILTSHAWVTDRLHSRSNLSGSAINSSNPASREIGHGFLSLTFTRALRRNLKKRLQKLNIETPPCEPNSLGDTFGKFFYHKYVSELCLTMVPCDFIFNLDPVSSLLQNIYTLESEKSKPKHLKSIPTVSDESTAMPWFTSSNLPLIYADMECIRLFLPGPDRSKVGLTGQQGTLWTTADHDMLLFQVWTLSFLFEIYTFCSELIWDKTKICFKKRIWFLV
ncbi:hypothetical protein DPMN_103723 [Dreissena polymorpha]|uniref:Uncharacterized protein n=1 Tax=Dreissena polymorpha TaxID=45954 RepID=A0A9D4K122_DREPO|nr:hypothetical protein DPMN_103723 [Dreissena polymorpha]